MGAWRYDMRTGEQHWTPRQFEIFGLAPGAVAPTRDLFLSLVHPDDLHLVEFGIDDVRPEGTFLDTEFRIIRPDGEVRWVAAHALARFAKDGRPVEVIGVNQDVTERKRAEEAMRASEERLRRSEERFRMLSEEAPVMLWLSDANGGCLHLNRALREFWGVEESAVSGFDWRVTMHPDDAAGIGAQMMEALRTQSAIVITGRYRDSTGAFRVLRTDAKPRFSSTGEFLGMIGVNTDITERVAAERALAANEARLRRAHTAGRIGDWEIDLDTSEMVWSDSQYELIGIPKSDRPPSRDQFDERIHPDDRDRVAAAVAKSLQTGRFDTEFRVRLADGSYHWLAARGEILRDAAGRPRRMVGVNFDITAEREASERQKLLIDELNHRVKNTLALVQSFASLTLKHSSPEEFRDALMGRVLALAAAHDLLTKTHWSGASITALISAELAALKRPDMARISWQGEEVALTPRQALGLGMSSTSSPPTR